jgi:hypothetical protein
MPFFLWCKSAAIAADSVIQIDSKYEQIGPDICRKVHFKYGDEVHTDYARIEEVDSFLEDSEAHGTR